MDCEVNSPCTLTLELKYVNAKTVAWWVMLWLLVELIKVLKIRPMVSHQCVVIIILCIMYVHILIMIGYHMGDMIWFLSPRDWCDVKSPSRVDKIISTITHVITSLSYIPCVNWQNMRTQFQSSFPAHIIS